MPSFPVYCILVFQEYILMCCCSRVIIEEKYGTMVNFSTGDTFLTLAKMPHSTFYSECVKVCCTVDVACSMFFLSLFGLYISKRINIFKQCGSSLHSEVFIRNKTTRKCPNIMEKKKKKKPTSSTKIPSVVININTVTELLHNYRRRG